MSDDVGRSGARYDGRTLGRGRFQIQRLLGEGGMASVHLALDTVLDRPVAVKTLHSDLGREQSFRDRFRREAQSVAKLSHTNIVSVFDSGEDELDGSPVPYIVMEYVEGRPLRDVLDAEIAEHGAMPAERALGIAADVLAALDASHEMGLVHRDIKPGNVMLDRRGRVKVMDFGIARAMQSGVTSMTQTGMVVGTPQYLSPEQALGRGVDARSDLYSVGILLFELLTGRLPFDADSPLAIAYAHVQEEPPAPSSINRAVTPAVDALVARALRKNPAERFPSAEAMQEECRRVAATGAATGTPTIVPGPPQQSGAGLGQAVFPPVAEGGTPPPHPQQQGYPGFGPSSPVPYAQPGPHGTPPPGPVPPYGGAPVGYPQQGGRTPPPYVTNPPRPGSGRSTTGRGILLLIVGLLLFGGMFVGALAIIGANADDSSGDGRAEGGSSPVKKVDGGQQGDSEGGAAKRSAGGGTGGSGFKPEDRSRTIDPSRCTEASKDYSDPGKVLMPDFTYKNLRSVKACISRAGWKLGTVTTENENLWGKNTVLEQQPDSIDSFDPATQKIDLTISTGKPPQ